MVRSTLPAFACVLLGIAAFGAPAHAQTMSAEAAVSVPTMAPGVTIRATVEAPVGVDTVEARVRPTDSIEWLTIPMAAGPAGDWVADVPSELLVPPGLDWYVAMVDGSVEKVETRLPDDAPASHFVIDVGASEGSSGCAASGGAGALWLGSALLGLALRRERTRPWRSRRTRQV